MLSLTHISQTQFRNTPHSTHYFEQRVTAVCGRNGAGKTNLLDSIYYLCFTKSYFNKPDNLSAEQGKLGFNISGSFAVSGHSIPVSVILRENNRKELWVDGAQVTPFSSHIGRFPAVFIAPDDVQLITGASEERRKLMDMVFSQLDQAYLHHLIRYNKTIQERNRYLKQVAMTHQVDNLLLDTFDAQLVVSGSYIQQKRTAFCNLFIPETINLFSTISNSEENPLISYAPSIDGLHYADALRAARAKDLMLQRTSVGIHRDDLEITLQGMAFRQIASQGQKKSMLFSLKLAEFQLLKDHFGYEPILLLDDIFEKLDQQRLVKLLEWVCLKNLGQVILTDTHTDRVQAALNDISVPFQLLTI